MSMVKDNWDLIEKFTKLRLDQIEGNFIPIFPDLTNKFINDIYGYTYRRNHIDIKTRQLITIGVLSAMGGCDNQLRFQIEAALNIGLSTEEIQEVFIQVAVFSGNSRAINAAIILHSIKEKMRTND